MEPKGAGRWEAGFDARGHGDARAGGDTSLAADNATLIFGLKLAGPSLDVTAKDKNPGEFDTYGISLFRVAMSVWAHTGAD
jgi:hypothetical protein